jgi:hypothetical protein
MFHRPQLLPQRLELRRKVAMSRFITFGLLDETNEERDPLMARRNAELESGLSSAVRLGYAH